MSHISSTISASSVERRLQNFAASETPSMRPLSEISNTTSAATRRVTSMNTAHLLVLAAVMPAWMAGWWASDNKGTYMEEVWTNPSNGLMLGMHRDVFPNGKVSFEFLRIESKDGSLVYEAMPGGRLATAFPIKRATESRRLRESVARLPAANHLLARRQEALRARGGSDAGEGSL